MTTGVYHISSSGNETDNGRSEQCRSNESKYNNIQACRGLRRGYPNISIERE